MDDVPPRWWNRHIRTRTQVTEIAVMFGALSIVSFWAAGLGVAAGLIAIVSALWADRSRISPGRAPNAAIPRSPSAPERSAFSSVSASC